METATEKAYLVVIGAGIFGLTTAHTYHRLHPEATIVILDSAPSIGGPWAPQRIFPGLRTNNLWGMYEHPDFPMDETTFGVKRGEHIPAAKMFDYLTAFVEWADIKQFLRLQTNVNFIERVKNGKGWNLHWTAYPRPDSTLDGVLHAKKLVIAVGNTNKPVLPDYPTSKSFQPLVIHAKDFPSHYPDIVRPNSHTVIVGSGKSAWDVAYACATQPSATATILIRPDGNGPVWMTPSHVTPLGLWLEKLVHTRFFGFMSPCPWARTCGIEGWFRSFFHRTWPGRKIVGAFWNILGEDAIALNGLDNHTETRKLRPWRGAFEVGTGLSIHNYPTNFFDLVREGKIHVLVDEVDKLDGENEVVLKSGDALQTDAIVCATGWQKGYTFRFRPEGLGKDLGVPSQHPTPDEQSLAAKSEAWLYKKFPYLKTRDTSRMHHPNPSFRYAAQQPLSDHQPYRLYRFMVPPDRGLMNGRDIAFAGALFCLGTFPCAYIQSLWISRFFDLRRTTQSLSSTQALEETYRDTQYCALRGAMSYGSTMPDLVFDTLPYFDMLLTDLEVEGRRKGGGIRECVKSYGPEDYRGLLDGEMGRLE
ncbi:flavin-binding monooxygenase-like protein-like protein [Decorospora gaudefroyi]|uniref:Flavin-binding monooxygenase-like protein-like protein n=1 Tax=Decorospora gaudefroyi TaxID=184978 RepID=A0A6A5KP87_9PLEO|nr:flavin-binding monooxygenase-like protein-like protein [Decorospora gaudefroyi]